LTLTAELAGPEARWLVGRLAEYRDLLSRLDERPGLLVIEADPLSGTSALVAHLAGELSQPVVYVDARGADGSADLAFAIAAAAVQTFAPEAAGWWNATTPALDPSAVRMMGRLREGGPRLMEQRELPTRSSDPARLRGALQLVSVLAEGAALLVVDHLDALLERVSQPASVEIIGVLRADRQGPGRPVEQLLVGRTGGRLARALDDDSSPLYRAGQALRIRRAKPRQFVEDMAIGRSWVSGPVSWVGAAAELAAGCPAYVWRLVDEAHHDGQEGDGPTEPILRAWQTMQQLSAPGYAQRYQELASVAPAAPLIVSALSAAVKPYTLGMSPNRVHDALTRLHARGTIFAPQPRSWAVSDPLLAAWARQHLPASLRRQAARIST